MNGHSPLIFMASAVAALVATVASAASEGTSPPDPPGLVRQIKVLPDHAPDCTSLESIAQTVTRGCSNNDARAIAIYNFMQLTHYHRAYPTEPGGVPALKEINCYGWSLCGGLHAIQSAIWRELGWDWRFVGWRGHTTVEARYDDRWHYLDVFLKFYGWMPDGQGGRTIAGEDDLNGDASTLIQDIYIFDEGRRCVYRKDNPFVLNDDQVNWRAPEFLACGDTLSGVIEGLKTHRGRNRAEGWGGLKHADDGYTADVHLAPGFSLENTWDAIPGAWYWAGHKEAPRHTCGGHKDTRNNPGFGLVLEPYVDSKPARSYGNGILSFDADFSNPAFLKALARSDNVKHAGDALVPAEAGKPASLVLHLASPYLLTRAQGEAVGADSVEVSVDGGKTYQAADLGDFSAKVRGQTAAFIKVTFREALKALKIRAIVQNNPGSLPYLSPGRNAITVAVADPGALGDNRLVVTYAYRLGSRSKSFAQLCDEGKEIAKQHNARWSDTVTCVQKTFSAADLPATFEIDSPTPKGRFPVYPRMVFLRREVVAPGAAPQPLPVGAVRATVGREDELVSLPNPFLVATEPPPVLKTRPTETTRIRLRYVQYSDEKGGVSAKGTLRWPKNRAEDGKVIAGVVVVSGALRELESLTGRDVAAARLIVPVRQGHTKAPGKLGVVFLDRRIAPGQAADVKKLTGIAATALIPRQPADTPEYRPAKRIIMDVTRPLKAIASGEREFRGLALRIVPDRGTDDGWTVRCDIPPAEPILIELDRYADRRKNGGEPR